MADDPLQVALDERRAGGRKLLIPYVMAGQCEDWLEVLQAIAEAGADAIEVGLPFSDPILDGPVIQQAALTSLERGTTPAGALAQLGGADIGVPLVVMTYYNLIFRGGLERMAGRLSEAGVSGVILPDLSLEELDPWATAAGAAELSTVLLVAPSTSAARTEQICQRAQGFVYAVGRMGVTGERSSLGDEGLEVIAKVRPHTALPICMGIGVSNAEQASQVVATADGAVVGSALVRRLAEGQGPEGAARFVAELRAGIDSGA